VKQYKLHILIFALSLIIALLLVIDPGIVIMGLVFLLWYFFIQRSTSEEERSFVNKIFIWGILFRVIILVVGYYASVLSGSHGEIVPDSRFYSLKALYIYKMWLGDKRWHFADMYLEMKPSGFIYMLAFFYRLINYSPCIEKIVSVISDKLINVYLGVGSGLLIYFFTREIIDRKTARIAGILAMFYPTLVLWSVTNIREPIHIFLVSLLAYAILKFNKERKIVYLLILVVSLLVFKTIRGYLFVMLAVASTVSLYINSRMKIMRKITLLPVIGILLFIVWLVACRGRGILPDYLTSPFKLAAFFVTTNYSVVAQGGSAYRIYDVTMMNPANVNLIRFVFGAIKGIMLFLVVPFPWQVRTALQLISLPAVLLWYGMIPFTVIGMLTALRYRFRESLFLLIYLIFSSIAYGLIEGNIGSAMRHRDTLVPFFAIFCAIGITNITGYLKNVWHK